MGQCCSAPSAHEGAAAAPAAAPQAFRAAGGAPAAGGLERALSVSSVDFGDARTHFSASVDLGGVLPGAHAAAADDVEGGLAMECRPSHAGGLYAEQLLAAGGLTAAEEAVCALWEEGRVLSAERAAQALPEGGSRAAHRLRLALAAEAHRVRAAWGQARGCERREGWKHVSDGALQIWYRHTRGSKVHSFCFRATIPSRPEHLMALCREADLTPTWHRYLRAASVLCSTGVSRAIHYYNQWVPWPFAHRDVILHSHGVDALDELGALVIMLRAAGGGQPSSQQYAQQGGSHAGDAQGGAPVQLPGDVAPLPAESKGSVSVDVHEGSCLTFVPKAPGADGVPLIESTIMVHVDPYFPRVPTFIIDFVLRILAPFIYRQVVAITSAFDTDKYAIFRQRIDDSPTTPLYDLVKRRFAAHSAQKFASSLEADGNGAAPNGADRA